MTKNITTVDTAATLSEKELFADVLDTTFQMTNILGDPTSQIDYTIRDLLSLRYSEACDFENVGSDNVDNLLECDEPVGILHMMIDDFRGALINMEHALEAFSAFKEARRIKQTEDEYDAGAEERFKTSTINFDRRDCATSGLKETFRAALEEAISFGDASKVDTDAIAKGILEDIEKIIVRAA